MIVDQSVTQLTMHGLAREAGTSIGSLYHFFPDKQRVLEALAERHEEALSAITTQISELDDSVWVKESAEGVIAHLIVPIFEYVEKHRDLVSMIYPVDGSYRFNKPELRMRIEGTYAHMLGLRLPKVDADTRHAYVQALMALPMGIFQVACENSLMSRRLLVEELPRALTAYLKALEEIHTSTG